MSLRDGAIEAAVQALTADVWSEGRKGRKPITGYAEHQSVLTIAADSEITGFNLRRGSLVALDALLDYLEANIETADMLLIRTQSSTTAIRALIEDLRGISDTSSDTKQQ